MSSVWQMKLSRVPFVLELSVDAAGLYLCLIPLDFSVRMLTTSTYFLREVVIIVLVITASYELMAPQADMNPLKAVAVAIMKTRTRHADQGECLREDP